ncbi:hypothetical protein [Pseudobacteriovorax antillogorgiicola]|uniref:hypothetical protein n=1 Tax=Pseudobacteriovorax antillogorgiicola TaxID=1513793 RepID=UPI00104F04CC|nr:hypothetical protein [Pseudobacteriovorax antillogorgiicola]
MLIFALILVGCDWYHKDKCEWYLVPEPDDASKVEPGWVALCARNYVINKQRCLLKAKLPFAKAVYGKPFRYNTLEVKPGTYPKEVLSIKTCNDD